MSARESILESARRFTESVVYPGAAGWERARCVPREVISQAAASGLTRIEVAQALGGLGLAFSVKAQVAEVIAQADFGLAMSIINTGNIAAKLARDARPELAARYLSGLMDGTLLGCTALTEPGAGSDFGAIRTHALRTSQGWRINGAKAWITNAAQTDIVVLYAQTEPGSGARGIAGFLVDARRAGFVHEPSTPLWGQNTIGAGSFTLVDYEAHEDELLQPPGQAFKAALQSINGARVYIAAMCCGMVEEALRICCRYGEERQTFGQSLWDHQGWRWRIATASSQWQASRLIVEQAAATIDSGHDAQLIAAQAKLVATTMAECQLPILAQAMGAEGLREHYPFGRHLHGARVAAFVDGSSEMLLERVSTVLRAQGTPRH